jgi:hypothetical protein
MLADIDVAAPTFTDAGVITVISDSLNKSGQFRAFLSLACVILGSVACGCDSRPPGNISPSAEGSAVSLPPEKLEKWVGEGASKHKEAISRQERLQLIREATKKSN